VQENNSIGLPEEALPLPANWEIEFTPEGVKYYVDHNNRRTHWIHPLARENLPHGWTKIFDPQHGVVYYNENAQRSQFEHPGIAASGVGSVHMHESASMMSIAHAQSTTKEDHKTIQHRVDVENLNIINETIPDWLRIYAVAPSQSDHLLNFNLFKLHQLQRFDEMLMKLFKQEAIDTVIKYERPRREINWELTRRQQYM
jgi:scaffold protein salvador